MKNARVRLSHFTLSALALASALGGCATSPPRPTGAIVPLEGGRYQSSVQGLDGSQALKTFTRDAEITCAKPEQSARMPWDAKPAPARYVVLSQVSKTKDGKEIKSDNKNLDAGIAVGLRYVGLEAKDSVEVVTVFRCE